MSIASHILDLKRRVQKILESTGKLPDSVRIVLVSKTVEPLRILEAFQAGIQDFGENRVQELLRKKKELPDAIRWHMIGHLQTNKVKDIITEVELIHSIDRPELVREIEKEAVRRHIGRVQGLIQVNTSEEESKFGLRRSEVEGFVAGISIESPLKILGLMTIGPLTAESETIRKSFRALKEIQEKVKLRFPKHSWNILSMGMSGDFPMAIEEGATLIRVGTAVFGARTAK